MDCTRQNHKWVGEGIRNVHCERCGRPYLYAKLVEIRAKRGQ